jgi:transcriptional regulator GlxA family with amidase domain
MIDTIVVALEGALDAAVALPASVFETANRLRAAARRPPLFRVRTVGLTRLVRLSSGLRIEVARHGLARLEAQLIVLPGLSVSEPSALLRALEREDLRQVVRWLRRQHQRGAVIAGSCTASFLLAEAGLLDGQPATTSWWLAPLFRSRYPRVRLDAAAMVTSAQRVLTAGAALAQADLALALVARFGSPGLAAACARYLVLEARTAQSRYMILSHLAQAHPEVARAEGWVRRHLAEDFAVADLARAVALSPRTLARRLVEVAGCAPIAFIQRVRLEEALHLLETTRLSVEEVSERVGYRNASTLRRLMARELGHSPRRASASGRRRGSSG